MTSQLAGDHDLTLLLQSTQVLTMILGHQARDVHCPVNSLKEPSHPSAPCSMKLELNSQYCLVTDLQIIASFLFGKFKEKTNHSQTVGNLVLHTWKESSIYWVEAFKKMAAFFLNLVLSFLLSLPARLTLVVLYYFPHNVL